MIKNSRVLEKFNSEYLVKKKYCYQKSLGIFEALWKEAVNFKIIPLKDPLEGIDSRLKIAKILNSKKLKK